MRTYGFLSPLVLLVAGCTNAGAEGRTQIAGATRSSVAVIGSSEPRPNIVLIVADDLGYGDLGAYGQRHIKTPVIDRLRAEGMMFTSHYSGSTVCAPSRASLMTGRDTGHTEIRGNAELGGYSDEEERGQMPLSAGTETLPALLRGAGYATGGFGKWGLGDRNSPGAPHRQGFDRFLGWLDQKQAHNYYPTHLWANDQYFALDNAFIDVHPDPAENAVAGTYRRFQGNEYGPSVTHSAAIDFIQANREKPFFLYLSYVQPHASLQIPDTDISRFGYAGAFPESAHDATGKEAYTPHPAPRAARAAMISRMDHDIGRILSEIDRLGLSDNTIVLVTSDNGPSLEGGADLAFFDSNGPYRGYKRDLYEGGIRVPLIVRWPGKVRAGSTSDAPVAFWDYLATLAQIAGARNVAGGEGVSMLPILTGKSVGDAERVLYWEFFGERSARAMRKGRWKLLELYDQNTPGPGRLELYDIIADPGETTNLANMHPAVTAELLALMKTRRTKSARREWNPGG